MLLCQSLTFQRLLRSKFGEQFNTWVQRIPAFIPNWKNYTPPLLKFSLLNVLRREYNTLLQIVVVSFLLESFGDWFDTKRLTVSTLWCIFLLTGIWACLRALKCHSSVLEVERR